MSASVVIRLALGGFCCRPFCVGFKVKPKGTVFIIPVIVCLAICQIPVGAIAVSLARENISSAKGVKIRGEEGREQKHDVDRWLGSEEIGGSCRV